MSKRSRAKHAGYFVKRTAAPRGEAAQALDDLLARLDRLAVPVQEDDVVHLPAVRERRPEFSESSRR